MKKIVGIIIILISITSVLSAQTQDENLIKELREQLHKLENGNKILQQDLRKQKIEYRKQIQEIKDSLVILDQQLRLTRADIETISNDLGLKISATETNANKKIETLDDTLSTNTLYWIIAVLGIALLSILLFFLLRKQLSNEKLDITKNIQQTKKVLEEEGVKLDSKLVELLATQMQLMKEERLSISAKTDEVNHELALKVADEIIRIQKNLGNMDAETKGLKQLVASVKRIQDNFESNGYELVDMLNKPYDQGMKVSANFRPDESLKPGEQIISRIIKPQVNFKGIMIQAAQIEVSIGE